MSQIWMVKMSSQKTFGQPIKAVFKKAQSICSCQEIHIIFDSYLEKSTKESERIHRASSSGSMDLVSISSETEAPDQLEKFWASPFNIFFYRTLQKLKPICIHHNLAFQLLWVVFNIINDEVLPSHMYTNGEAKIHTTPHPP